MGERIHIPKARPYYNLVKAVLAQAVRDKCVMKGRTIEFMIDAYWILKEQVHLQEGNYSQNVRGKGRLKDGTI